MKHGGNYLLHIFTYVCTSQNNLVFAHTSSWDNKYIKSLLSPSSMKIIVLYFLASALDCATT